MNILIMTDKLITGGAENYFCSLENRISHPEMTVYTAAAGGELFPKIKNKEHFIEMKRDSHFHNLKVLCRQIKKNDIDMIHANSLRMVMYGVCCKALISKRIKLIYTKHNVTFLEKRAPALFTVLMNHFVEKIIAVSNFEKKNLVDLGVKSGKVTTIYNGVNLDEFTFSRKEHKGQKKIGILARLSAEKNHDLFLNIAKSLEHAEDLSFYIAGDGPEFDNIKRKISSLNLQGKVIMTGATGRPQEFIREMDVLLLTSEREVFPMVILEAMAVGTPVISINRGGISEAISDQITGFLIENHSEEEFSSKVINLSNNRELQLKISNCAREKSEKEFSLDSMVSNTVKEYLKQAY